MDERKLKLQLLELFLAGYHAGRSGEKNPVAAFENYWCALTAGKSDYMQ